MTRSRLEPGLVAGLPPRWAVAWGEDRCGSFAEFAVGRVRHRLRWIPLGRFWMGSPEGEAGRHAAEGPRHEVTLARGFWLGETPVTQRLWEAVTGANPSRFRSAESPVEHVSWPECVGFCGRLNVEVEGLGVRLPTEAEWEYACRAGTDGATWLGKLAIRGENDTMLFDGIASYRMIDAWFDGPPPVLFLVADASAVDPLVSQGTLAKAGDPVESRPPSRRSASDDTPTLPKLKPLLQLPLPLPLPAGGRGAGAGGSAKLASPPTSQPNVAPPAAATLSGAPGPVAWTLVWRSKGLVRRDLTIPKGDNTHQTGSMLLKKGDWADIDQRHYFRDEVFDTLAWTPSKGTLEEAEASFVIVVHGTTVGKFMLALSHNTDTTSRSYEQNNSMTSLRWGDARPHVAKDALLGSIMELWRAGPSGSEYRIVIRPV